MTKKKIEEIEEIEDVQIIEDEQNVHKKITITEEMVATTAPPQSIIPPSRDRQSAAIAAAGSWDDKIAIAENMLNGGLVPKSFAGDPGAVISAVEMGMEIGLGAWTALNNIVVIEGKATLTLNAMLALARSKGVLIKIEKDYELLPVEKKTKEGVKKGHDRATVVVITRGEDIYSPSGKLLDSRVSEYTYTKYWQDAVKAKLTDKSNWVKMPR